MVLWRRAPGLGFLGWGVPFAISRMRFPLNLVFDCPMFAYGPMQMTASRYYSEIGVGHLAFPAFAFWPARLTRV